MNTKKLVAGSAAALLSLGLVAAPATSAVAAPPGNGHGHVVVKIDKAAWKQAKADLRAALVAANKQLHADLKAAIAAFRADTADERAVLKAVLLDETATDEAKQAAKAQYRADTADERATRKEAFVTAKKTWREARVAAWKAFRAAVTA